jgi:transcription antitermination factor NusG
LSTTTQFGTDSTVSRYPWFALRVKSNRERVTAMHLRSRGIEEFSPIFTAESQWSDRKKLIDRSVFPGYVFCRLNPEDKLPALTIPGVVTLVGFGNGPSAIPEHEIEAVRRAICSGVLVAPWPFLETGQRVLIEKGPLAGVEGILEEIRKSYRLIVSITLLQRSVAAEIDRSWIRPIGPARRTEPATLGRELRGHTLSLETASSLQTVSQ